MSAVSMMEVCMASSSSRWLDQKFGENTASALQMHCLVALRADQTASLSAASGNESFYTAPWMQDNIELEKNEVINLNYNFLLF
jgi:hypothetical protein